MRMTVAVVTACLIGGTCVAGDAKASMKKSTDVPAQNLGRALQALAKDRDIQVIYFSKSVDALNTRGARGRLTTDEAFARILRGTGLIYRYLDARTITILVAPGGAQPVGVQGSAASLQGQSGPAPAPDTHAPDAGKGAENPPYGRRFRLAQVATSADEVNARSTASSADSAAQLEEVLVTAQKRDQRLQDVPVPVTALNAESLANANHFQLNDYYSQLPGLNLTTGTYFGSPQLTVRGISTGAGTNPTVGIVVDDVPYGASTYQGGRNEMPDIDPSDIARIELLRGPQGTLYGASSMGGLLKYVTAAPTTRGFSGYVQAGTDWTTNAGELGYSVRGAVNIPLGESIAMRASGFSRADPGYIDNVLTRENAINSTGSRGGRLAALWHLTDDVALKLSALYQHATADGAAVVSQGFGELEQNTIRDTGWYEKTYQVYSATLDAKLGGIDLTSLTGFNINHLRSSVDVTPLFGGPTQAQFDVTGTPGPNNLKTRKVSQEIRASGTAGSRVDWLVGVFYTKEDSNTITEILAADPFSGTVVGAWLSPDIHRSAYAEYAAFGDLTVHFSDRFEVQFGARESQNHQKYSEELFGPYDEVFLGFPSPVIQPEIETEDRSLTYLLTPQYKFSPETMLYARLASGYRAGGANSLATLFATPLHYEPDKTTNYEIGFKGDFAEHRLSVDASVYYIQWKDIQISLVDPQAHVSYTGNRGSAKSQGVELAVEERPFRGLTLSGWVAFGDAKLTEDFPGNSRVYAASGNRLPFSTRLSGNLGFDWQFPIVNQWNGFVSGTLAHVGNRIGEFTRTPLREEYGSYTKADLQAGATYESWRLTFFGTNLTDKHARLAGGLGTNLPVEYTILQPRTVGLNVSRRF